MKQPRLTRAKASVVKALPKKASLAKTCADKEPVGKGALAKTSAEQLQVRGAKTMAPFQVRLPTLPPRKVQMAKESTVKGSPVSVTSAGDSRSTKMTSRLFGNWNHSGRTVPSIRTDASGDTVSQQTMYSVTSLSPDQIKGKLRRIENRFVRLPVIPESELLEMLAETRKARQWIDSMIEECEFQDLVDEIALLEAGCVKVDKHYHFLVEMLAKVQERNLKLSFSMSQKGSQHSKSLSAHDSMSSVPVVPRVEHRLAREQLKEFQGEDFPFFWSSYKDLVLRQRDLSDIAKFRILRNALKIKEDREMLADIDPENPDLAEVESRMKEKYVNAASTEARIKQDAKRMAALSDEPSLSNWEVILNATRALERRSKPFDDYFQRLILSTAFNKLPRRFREEFSSKEAMTLKALTEFLSSKTKVARAIDALQGDTACESPKPEGKGGSGKKSEPRKPFFNAGGQHPRSSMVHAVQDNCPFCDQSHKPEQCHLSVDARQNAARERSLCFHCFAEFDRSHKCKRQSCPKCPGKHHVALCVGKKPWQRMSASKEDSAGASSNKGQSIPQTETDDKDKTIAMAVQSITERMSGASFLKMVKLEIKSQGQTAVVRAHIDPGSQHSYIAQSLVERLQLKEISSTPTLLALAGGQTVQVNMGQVKATLCSLTEEFSRIQSLSVLPKITNGQPPKPSVDIVKWMNERGFILSDLLEGPEEIELLFGTDMIPAIDKRLYHPIIPKVLDANDTVFGWCLEGTDRCVKTRQNAHTCHLAISATWVPSYDSDARCVCDNIKVLLGDVTKMSPKDEQKAWLANFNKEIRYLSNEKRFEVPLPWTSKVGLKSNFSTARGQVFSLRKRLQSKNLYQAYDKAIMQFVVDGQAEPCDLLNDDDTSNCYYFPHHGVEKAGSTTQLRVVVNASSAGKDAKSLNQCVFKGPPLNSNLLGTLLKFRTGRNVIIGDLMKAFLQVKVREVDRDFLRFLWFDAEGKLRSYRMTVVAFGTASSPFLLGAVLQYLALEHKETHPEAARVLLKGTYMDDMIIDLQEEDDQEGILAQLHELLSKASFKLHKLASNCPLKIEGQLMEPASEIKTCLGMRWRPQMDRIYLKALSERVLNEKTTVRQAVSFLASVYDPMGLFLPYRVNMRVVGRDLLKETKDWDAIVPEHQVKKLLNMQRDLLEICEYSLPRTGDLTSKLHVFADASKTAIAAVAYLETKDGQLFLLTAQGSINPLSSDSTEIDGGLVETIPKLELKAACLAVKLAQEIKESITVTEVKYYSDSTVTLARIRNNVNKCDRTIAPKVLAIQASSLPSQWYHVRSELNPADPASRGVSWKLLKAKSLWWEGPSLDDVQRDSVICNLLVSTQEPVENNERQLCEKILTVTPPNPERFTNSLLYLLDKKFNYSERLNSGKEKPMERQDIALCLIMRCLQTQQFPGGIEEKEIQRFCPFIDEWGLIRCSRRLDMTDLPDDVKRPLLFKDHKLVRGWIETIHRRIKHMGVETTYSHVVERYQIIGGRRATRAVVQRCLMCIRMRGKTVSTPSAPLPLSRTVVTAFPFAHIGFDVFGPIKCQDKSLVYGLLFTCQVTRAVHLEPLTGTNTTQVFMAFERYIARRGVPDSIRCDNAKYFQALNKTVKRICELVEKAKPGQDRWKVNWTFQPPLAPWFGGFFERMVKNVKDALKSAVWMRRDIDYELVATVFCQIEAIVNSRPLDTLDDGIVLTPSHFFAGRRLTAFRPFPGPANLAREPVPIREHVELRRICNGFWSRFYPKHIATTGGFYRANNGSVPPVPAIGTNVLFKDQRRARMDWPVGKVKEHHYAPNGAVHVITVTTPEGEDFVRALKTVVPFEAACFSDGENVVSQRTSNTDGSTDDSHD